MASLDDSTEVNRKLFFFQTVLNTFSDFMMKINFHMVAQNPQTTESDVIWIFLTDMTVKTQLLVPNKLLLVSVNGLSDFWAHVLVNETTIIKWTEWRNGIMLSKCTSRTTLKTNLMTNQPVPLPDKRDKASVLQKYKFLYKFLNCLWTIFYSVLKLCDISQFMWFHDQFGLS